MKPYANMKRMLVAIVLVIAGIGIGLVGSYAMQRMTDAPTTAADQEKLDRDFDAMADWFENYKREHPEATQEETEQAFQAIWQD